MPNEKSLASADDLDWRVFAIEQIVPLNNVTPLWRIVTADFNAYSCARSTLIAPLQQAMAERRIVKAGIARDAEDREWIHSLVMTNDFVAPPEATPETKRSPQLLF